MLHLARAREASARMVVPGAPTGERSAALREVGRAIALAPDDPEALALLVRILTEPPKEAPSEVLASIERSARASQRKMLPRMALAYSLSWVIFFPLQVAMGIRSWTLALLPLSLWMLTSLLAWVAYRLDHTGPRVFPYVTLSGAVALAATTVLHGPFFVVPAIGAVLAMGMALVKYKSHRIFSTAVFGLAVGGPALLAWAGLHPVTHRFVDGAFILMPGAIQLPRDGTFVFLTMVNVLVLLFAAKFAGEYRDQLTSLELENHLQAWQLRQLVPAEAARALDPGLPGGK